ncbi:MAG: hypothetical protein K2J65_10925 [Duncaniella sp.]|nr:hypothetical protein [Duncaniella sp.]
MQVKTPEQIKLKPKLAEIINHIPRGESVKFDAVKHGPVSTAKAAVSRANKRLGTAEWKLTTDDNGVTYIVTRSYIPKT